MPKATKLGRMVTHHEGLQLITSLDPSITWPCEDTWQIKYFTYPLVLWTPMDSKHDRKVTYCKGFPPIKSHNPWNTLNHFKHVVTWNNVVNWIGYISICNRPMFTKLGKVMTCYEKVQPLNLHDLALVTWLSPFSQDFWPLNLVGCWLQGGGSERKCLSRRRLLVYCKMATLI